MQNTRLLVSVTSLIMLTSAGCSKSQPWEKTIPVAGSVTLKGKPIQGAELAFFPQDASFPTTVRPKAKADDSGRFIVWTYEQGDGAPPGSYKVTVVRNAVGISKETIVAKPNDLPLKYSTIGSTDIVVTVADGQSELPTIDLK